MGGWTAVGDWQIWVVGLVVVVGWVACGLGFGQ